MNNQQIYISLEIIGVMAILAGIGAYLYFASPDITLESLPFLNRSTPTTMPTSTRQVPEPISPTPSPPSKTESTMTVTVTAVQGNNRFSVTTESGSKLILELNLEEEVTIGETLKLYLGPNSEILRVEKLNPSAQDSG